LPLHANQSSKAGAGVKAVVLLAYGDANALVLREVPDPPAPGPREIKVRVVAAGLNPVDWKLRSGALASLMPLELPVILGRDVAGTVTEVGPGVEGFRVGEPVMGLVNHGYAELVVASVDGWTHVPVGLATADAAALPLVMLTGAQLVEEAIDAQPGDRVLVTGALGSVGRVALYAARARKATVVAGVRGSQKDAAARLGVDAVVAIDDDGEVARMPELDAIADTVGGDRIGKLIARLKRGGTLGSVLGASDAVKAAAKERGVVVRAIFTHPDARRMGELARAAAEGALAVPISRRFPLAKVAEAHAMGEKHEAGGKLLLLM
jgi:NADPH:quinone reductase-like Zn-dependent oxidoreductase